MGATEKWTCEDLDGNRCKAMHATYEDAERHCLQRGGRRSGLFVVPANNAARIVMRREIAKEAAAGNW